MKRPHAGDMELAVAMLLNYRIHSIVPNVYWGWGLRHEADMIAVNGSGYVTEIEIKVTKSDLVNDFKKEHGHESKKIHRLVYAVPDNILESAMSVVPERFGIIAVKTIPTPGGERYSARWIRRCKYDKSKPHLSSNDLIKLLDLGCMWMWSIKFHNNNRRRNNG